MAQGVHEQIRALAAVEPEGHFIEVSCEMLCADLMPRAHDAPLQQRESILDGVSVNLTHYVDFPAVVDGPMVLHPGLLHGELVGGEVVGHDYVHILADVLADVLRERSRLYILSMEEAQITIPLANADDDFFVLQPCACSASLVLAADVGFVHLDGAIQH